MFCKNCGKLIGENASFCTGCGAKIAIDRADIADDFSGVESNGNSDDNLGTNRLLIPVLVFIVILICIVAGIAVFLNRPQAKLNRYLSLGEKYLDEEEYEEAIIEFQKAIDIDPKNLHAYKGMIEAYAIAVDSNKNNTAQAVKYYDEALLLIKEANGELSNHNVSFLEKEMAELLPPEKYSLIINSSSVNKSSENDYNRDDEITNQGFNNLNPSGAIGVAEELTGVPYTGDKSYRLRYYPKAEKNYSWGITYPDEELLVHVDQNDYDLDGKDEILAILLVTENDAGSFLVEMMEEENGTWNIEDILEVEADVYNAASTQYRADVFFRENGGRIEFFKEEYAFAGNFADGIDYNLEGWIYDGSSFISRYPKMETAGSDGTAEAILDMDPGFYLPEDPEYEYIMDGINSIRSMNFNPMRLGLEYPICASGGCELLVRIRRKDDSDRWIYDANSPYGFVLDPDGYLGNIDLTIDNNEHPRRKKQ